MDSPGPLEIPPPPPTAPTSAPKIFGVLSIIFASLVGFGGLLGSCSGLMVSSVGKMGPSEQPMLKPMATVYAGIGAQSLLLLAMSGLLLAIGIGQLRYREWARRWSVYWGVLGVISVAALVAISMLVVGPAYKDMLGVATQTARAGLPPPAMPSSLGAMFGASFAILYVFLYLPYPILMLAVFTRPKIRLAMYK